MARHPPPTDLAAIQASLEAVVVRLAKLEAAVTAMAEAAGARPAADELLRMPIWKNGRRPAWWSNPGIRAFVVASHRGMTIQQCVDETRARFGDAVSVSKSSVQRVWAQIDTIRGNRR